MTHDRQTSGAVPNLGDSKRLIACCDGTGNEIAERTEKLSNVLKLFRCLRGPTESKTRQIVFYHPGGRHRSKTESMATFFASCNGILWPSNRI
jgi:uncharacterized protein (DUF2235 family)